MDVGNLEPAQRILVNRYLDWELVDARLDRYPSICRNFYDDQLRRCANEPPYYCHHLAWRLGTYRSNQSHPIFARFNDLLSHAAALPGWEHERRRLMPDCTYEQFWSVLWQLQVAGVFERDDCRVEWLKDGPDLRAEIDGAQCFVECYAFQKSFGAAQFVRELFGHLSDQIEVSHRWYLPMSLPKNKEMNQFLDELFRPCLDAEWLAEKEAEAQESWPVFLPVPEGTRNCQVYVKGPSAAYDPSRLQSAAGNPDAYLAVMIAEIINNKRRANNLAGRRPNVVMANCILGPDFQSAVSRAVRLKQDFRNPDLGGELDALVINFCGIDDVPSPTNAISWWSKSTAGHHPFLKVWPHA